MTKRKIGAVKLGATAYSKADLSELESLTMAFRKAARQEHARVAMSIRQVTRNRFTKEEADELAWVLLKLTKKFGRIKDAREGNS